MTRQMEPILLQIRIDASGEPLELFTISFEDGSRGWRDIKSDEDQRELVALIPPQLRAAFARALSLHADVQLREKPGYPPRATPEVDTSEAVSGC